MREIKFRAWDFISKQMFEVDDIRMRGNAYTVSVLGFSDKQWLTPERHALMQYTGLKDKNGKEIWEGDILRTRDYITTVSYEAPGFVCRYDYGNAEEMDFDYFEECEVLGNIYASPELLK